jgi:hypothetical protein
MERTGERASSALLMEDSMAVSAGSSSTTSGCARTHVLSSGCPECTCKQPLECSFLVRQHAASPACSERQQMSGLHARSASSNDVRPAYAAPVACSCGVEDN